MSLIETIVKNNLNGYQQSEFGKYSRRDLYELAKMTHQKGFDNKDYSIKLKELLIAILEWGIYDTTAGRYSKLSSRQVIEAIPDFEKYAGCFYRGFVNNESDQLLFKKFQSNGSLKIKDINTSYFTKIFQFYSVGNDLHNKMFIMDKWSIVLFCALLIEKVDIKNADLIDKLFDKNRKSVKNINAETYSKFNQYVIQTSAELKMQPERLEELMFGWNVRNKIDGFNNPRIEALKIIQKYS